MNRPMGKTSLAIFYICTGVLCVFTIAFAVGVTLYLSNFLALVQSPVFNV